MRKIDAWPRLQYACYQYYKAYNYARSSVKADHCFEIFGGFTVDVTFQESICWSGLHEEENIYILENRSSMKSMWKLQYYPID